MEFKKYTEEEFGKWCEEHTVEDNFGIWDFIKEQKVHLAVDTNEEGDDSTLIIHLKLMEC